MIQNLLEVDTFNFQNKAFYFQRLTGNVQSFNKSRLRLSSIQINILHFQQLYTVFSHFAKKIPGKVCINPFLSLSLDVPENSVYDAIMKVLECR